MAFAETFKALSDPVRREILNLLKGGRLTAGEITGQFDMTAATVSYHLSLLKKAGLIFESREKNFIYYSLNPVLRTVLLWFCPAVSLLGGAVTLGTGLGYEMHISTVVPVFVGLLFLILGNYLPKIRQNRTMGIKLPWTLQSEENWTRTHRLSGFLWVLCGLVMIPLSLLRLWSGWLFGALLAVMVLIPAVYSYALHRKGI